MRRFIIISYLFVHMASFGQEPDDESQTPWVLFERGLRFYDEREYGLSLQNLTSAIELVGIFPEAEAVIGDIYRAEGEVELAERQYRKAYDLRKAFYVPEDAFATLYKLARLHNGQARYKQMEDTLQTIIVSEPRFEEQGFERLRKAFLRIYVEDGLDRLLVLYRLDSMISVEAHRTLGWFYYRTGRYRQSVLSGLFAAVTIMSEAIGELRRIDPEYEFRTTNELLKDVMRLRNIREFLDEARLYQTLYYLAAATFAFGNDARAREGWAALAAAGSIAGQHGELSAEQLRTPWIEPFLEEGPRSVEFPQ